MCVTSLLVTIGLTVLHVPLAAGLGILAGVLAFVPNIGAFVAAAPAVVLAFVQSPATALAVAVMYVLVHVLDDFVVAPVLERQVVKLPPVLTLVSQILLGIATGAAGMMLAAPLLAATIVIVRRLWVEDVADASGATPGPVQGLKGLHRETVS
jgi:predicted PurR-regulated permease PerM